MTSIASAATPEPDPAPDPWEVLLEIRKRLIGYATNFGLKWQDGENAFSHVVLTVQEGKLPPNSDAERITKWAFTVVKYYALNYHRERMKWGTVEFEEDIHSDVSEDQWNPFADSTLFLVFLDVLCTLSNREREIIVGLYIYGKSRKEIAAALHVSVQAICLMLPPLRRRVRLRIKRRLHETDPILAEEFVTLYPETTTNSDEPDGR